MSNNSLGKMGKAHKSPERKIAGFNEKYKFQEKERKIAKKFAG